MRQALRLLGIVLLVAASGCGVASLLSLATGSGQATIGLDGLWQALVRRDPAGPVEQGGGVVADWLGPPWRLFLAAPAWLTLGLPGLALVLVGRGRERGFR